MKIQQPQQREFTPGVLRWAQSVYKSLTIGLSFGNPTGQNPQGVYNRFTPDNFDGILIRIGASGSSETYSWAGANIGLNINHGLLRQPIGFIVVDKDINCDIYRTITPPTKDIITLASTVAGANVTVFIF